MENVAELVTSLSWLITLIGLCLITAVLLVGSVQIYRGLQTRSIRRIHDPYTGIVVDDGGVHGRSKSADQIRTGTSFVICGAVAGVAFILLSLLTQIS